MGKRREMKEVTINKKKKGRIACCEKEGVRRGVWTTEEDKILVDFIAQKGHGTWRNLPKRAGLLRCGKSCRLRWTNYIRPDIKRGPFSPDEENTIIHMQNTLGNKWSVIASHLPGRTDNDIKNFWNTRLRKRLSNTKRESPRSCSKSDGHDHFFPHPLTSEFGESFHNTNESTDEREFDESSGAMLKLLLDFPVGGDDVELI